MQYHFIQKTVTQQTTKNILNNAYLYQISRAWQLILPWDDICLQICLILQTKNCVFKDSDIDTVFYDATIRLTTFLFEGHFVAEILWVFHDSESEIIMVEWFLNREIFKTEKFSGNDWDIIFLCLLFCSLFSSQKSRRTNQFYLLLIENDFSPEALSCST